MSTRHIDTLEGAASGVATITSSILPVMRIGLWTLLAAHLVTVWGTSWDIRWHTWSSTWRSRLTSSASRVAVPLGNLGR